NSPSDAPAKRWKHARISLPNSTPTSFATSASIGAGATQYLLGRNLPAPSIFYQRGVMELIDEYLAALEVGDAKRVLALFAPDGIVHSPLYGAVPARQFYPTLFADTAELRVTLRRVFRDDGEAVAFWLDVTRVR